MKGMMVRLWHDDSGALLATEWVFMATILVIGLIVGLRAVQQAVLNEMEEFAGAIGSLSQSFSFGGNSGCCGFSNRAIFNDQPGAWPIDTCVENRETGTLVCPD
jgi:Flp pilus assembly pilin Flp